MRFGLQKALLLPGILCLVVILAGIAVGDDNETYGAYAGAPQSVTDQTPAAATSQTGEPVSLLGFAGQTAITATYTTQAPPVTEQKVLLNYDVQTAPPTAVYYSGTFMPWSSYTHVFPANTPALWLASSAGWSWYANCPTGGWVQELMYVPFTGTLKLYEFYPDGTVKLYSYGFQTPGYKYMWFYADTPGRHITLFTISDKPSNYIAIDVY